MTYSKQADILIVGGGPAGLLAAQTAASLGVTTLLIEQEEQIGSPVHTSGAIAVQTLLDLDIPKQFYHIIKRIRFCSPNNFVVFDFKEPVGCIIDVTGMYQYLASRAQAKGTKIITGVRVTKTLTRNDFVVGCEAVDKSYDKYMISSKILIDATGYSAMISKQAGLHKGFARFGIGSEYELLAPNCRQDEAVIIVGNRYAPSGYSWVFPWGKNRVRIGVGILHADSNANPKEHLITLIDEAKIFNIDLSEYKVIEKHYGLVPAEGIARNLVNNGIMAIGDAAGQASLVVGEGIRLSMIAGQLAGEVAAQAVLSDKWNHQSLKKYEHLFRSIYGRNLAIGYIINKWMARWDNKKWDEGIQLLKTIPITLFINAIQSEFPIISMISWAISQPKWWPKFILWGIKGFAEYISKK